MLNFDPARFLRIQTGTPLLAQARGRVDFTQRGFTIVGGRARALGGFLIRAYPYQHMF